MTFTESTIQPIGIENCSKETVNHWDLLPKNSSLTYEPLPYQSETFPLTVTLTALGILGIIENIFIIKATSDGKKFRGPVTDIAGQRKALIYYFINNLGHSDIMTSLACIITVVQFHTDLFLNIWNCRLIRFVGFIFIAITMEILLVISVERYFAVVHPYRSFDSDTSKKLVRGAWCAGLILTVVATVTYEVKRVCVTNDIYTMACLPANNPMANVLSLLFMLLIYFIPGGIIAFTTLSTMHKIRSRTINTQPNAAEQLQITRTTKILLSVIVCFIIPYIGLVSYSMVIKYANINLGHKVSYFVGYSTGIVCFSNCVINPILFVCQMKSLQQKLKGYFKHFLKVVRLQTSTTKVYPSKETVTTGL